MFDKATLKEQLGNGVGFVKFTKKDGSTREMYCTRSSEFIPVVEINRLSSKKEKITNSWTEPEYTLSVWDLCKHEWRSFIVENVSEFRVLSDSEVSQQITKL